jgi:hypothetical protein
VSADFDESNIHDYLMNYNPGNSYALTVPNLARGMAGGKPIVATETGYGVGAGSPLVDDWTQLRYMTRLFLEYFNDGIARSYSYQFLELGGTSTFGQYGLLNPDLTPKPAYYGVKSLITAVADPGPAFTPSALSYRLSGFTSNVHHLLMQKRNGSYVLALWLEVSDWNTANPNGGDIIVAPQTVTLLTSAAFSSVTQQSMNNAGAFSNVPLTWSNKQATFNVGDTVSLITLTP